jgi:hypothetical protein
MRVHAVLDTIAAASRQQSCESQDHQNAHGLISSKETAPTRDEALRGQPWEMKSQGCPPTNASFDYSTRAYSSLFKIAHGSDS